MPTRHFPSDLGPFASRLAASLQRQVVRLRRRKTLHGSVKGVGAILRKKTKSGCLKWIPKMFPTPVGWFSFPVSTQTHNCVSSVTWFRPSRVDEFIS